MKSLRQSFQPINLTFGAVVLLVVGFCLPAEAQRSCSGAVTSMNLSFSTANSVPKVSARRAAASLHSLPLAVVGGGGRALLTDTDSETFSHQFSISATVNNDGSARGRAEFVFPMLFAQKWGALPGVADLMLLQGEVTAVSVAPDGTVELTGPFLETDYSRNDGIVYQEDSRVTGITPMKIVIAPDAKTFDLSWCAFIPPDGNGHFGVEVIKGNLKVR